MGCNGKWYGFVAVIVFIAVIITPHSDTLCAGFVGLQRAKARLITSKENLYVIFHYYVSSKEKLGTITIINVQANKWYVHIKYDF